MVPKNLLPSRAWSGYWLSEGNKELGKALGCIVAMDSVASQTDAEEWGRGQGQGQGQCSSSINNSWVTRRVHDWGKDCKGYGRLQETCRDGEGVGWAAG
jgi:hypothetical protein